MSPLEALRFHYIGKIVVGGASVFTKYIGHTVVNIGFKPFDNIFNTTVIFVVLQSPDGKSDTYISIFPDYELDVRVNPKKHPYLDIVG